MIVLTGKTEYKDETARKELAVFLSSLIEGNRTKDFLPEEVNDSFYWKINPGNDWKLQFFPDDPNRFGIIYRYDNGRHELAFANWLCVRMINVSVVQIDF